MFTCLEFKLEHIKAKLHACKNTVCVVSVQVQHLSGI